MTDPAPIPIPWQELPNAPEPGTCIGNLNTLGNGQAQCGTSEFPVLLLRSQQTVYAYANRCPHFGVPLANTNGPLHHTAHDNVQCNVHLARFRWTDGLCTWGDCAGEYLSAIPVEIDSDGAIRIKRAG
jgi:nitrite reductase/ring-hydroxylating ferredoxin subunit